MAREQLVIRELAQEVSRSREEAVDAVDRSDREQRNRRTEILQQSLIFRRIKLPERKLYSL